MYPICYFSGMGMVWGVGVMWVCGMGVWGCRCDVGVWYRGVGGEY